ncbi:MAG: ornithine cyclodeaminase family protein [Chloroflexi bacterium]|nr:ornithine cyclodeaminase family protein [Chloroflexota bacterium]
MIIRILNAEEVARALPMSDAIEEMKEAFEQLSSGGVTLPLRSRIHVEGANGTSLFMPALLHASGDMAIKIVSVFPQNLEHNLQTVHAIVITLDSQTGQPIAILEGGSLTAIRTGAASGAATDLLARPEASSLAIIGCGTQARTQLEAVCTVRSIERVWVYSLDSPGARVFASEMRGTGPIPLEITVVDRAADAVARADIICTATTSSTPVFNGRDLRPGTHINAIGSYTPEMQEIDAETIQRARVVVDSREAALAETGDLIIPIQTGDYTAASIHAELGEIFLGIEKGRTDPRQITLFKSVGIAVQDVVAAARALENAVALDLGTVIHL